MTVARPDSSFNCCLIATLVKNHCVSLPGPPFERRSVSKGLWRKRESELRLPIDMAPSSLFLLAFLTTLNSFHSFSPVYFGSSIAPSSNYLALAQVGLARSLA